MPVCGSGVSVSSCSLLIRGDLHRSQAENPLIPPSRFYRPPLPILVGEFFEPGLDQGLSRHTAQGVEHERIAYPAPRDLDVDHAVAGAGKVEDVDQWVWL